MSAFGSLIILLYASLSVPLRLCASVLIVRRSRPDSRPRPVAVGRLLNAVLANAQRRDERADFGEREGGVQRLGEHMALMIVGPGCVQIDKLSKLLVVLWPQQIAEGKLKFPDFVKLSQ